MVGLYLISLVLSLQFEFFWILLLPFFLTVGYLAIFKLDILLLSLAFLTPLSVNLEEFGDFPVAMFLPTEPIMFGIMLIFLIKLFYKSPISREVMLHPVSLIILFQFGWMLFTSITSTMPLVSFKFVLARLWFLSCFYFFAIELFKKPKNFIIFISLYAVGMLIVSGYTMYQHALHGFDHKSAHWVMSPFFKDHTSYGAMLAFLFPFLIGYYFTKDRKATTSGLIGLLLLVLTAAIILSFTRAAWLSLVVAIGATVMVWLRIKFRTLLLAVVGLGVVLFFSADQIIQKLEKNNQDAKGGLAEHVASITNISTDASNLERLNRWSAAFRMFQDKPVVGFGPGTYQFKYAPYQLPSEKTIISSNAGDVGNAHSEYIGPLAEQGLLGMVNMFLLVGFVIFLGVKLYYFLDDDKLSVLALCCTLALITYFTHAFLNNFLDTDKASVPVWGCIAMLVALDLYHRRKDKATEQ